jgi:ABC-type transport system involved in multi-copper enzyme maturation permease subunit
MWLIITLVAIFVGFDVVNNEEPHKSIQLTFLQPYKRSHIIITKVILRIFLTIMIIILSFVAIYFILRFNHEIGWLEQPVVYSPFSLGDNQARFADKSIMSLSDYFVLNALYIVLNISLVISLCALINTFIKHPHISMIAMIVMLTFFYIGLNSKALPSASVYCPYFYLFKQAIDYQVIDPGSLFYHYRQARYVYGLLLVPSMIAINIFITLYLFKRKELR